jgi:hypothetical protein
MRVRAFTQDDAHIFITEQQIAEEALKVNDIILSIYEDFGFADVRIKFSDRPEKRIGEDAVWDKAEAALMAALKASGRPWTLNKGEGAFYGPKLEYVLRDAIGRDWQCGTVQVDLNLPGRLGAFYIDEHSNKVTPVMLHRAMFGSLERFTGILIEHFAGHFPLWLSPTQAVVATIVTDADGYAEEVAAAARRAGLRVETDLRNEKINYKVREHSLAKVPVLLVVGKKEAESRTVSIRRLGSQEQKVVGLDVALAELAEEAVAPDVRRERGATGGIGVPPDSIPAPSRPAERAPSRPAETVRKIAEQALTDAVEINRLIESMQKQNASRIHERPNEPGAVKAADVTKNAELAWLVTLTARSYAEPRLGDLHVAAAVNLLKDSTTRQIFESAAGGAEKLAAFDAQWAKCRSDHRLRLVNDFRHKSTAHLGERKEIQEATYSDLFAFAKATASAMELLALATRVAVKPINTDTE